ncbi:uncharacterized protein LOC127794738 [Diospyros lotus]|uniref:uncharacterized protein LOC127794738 n=1 Tax=Diospyros lotus TaxID=55363 RepID=UPI002252F302|nr:uncharacterized protein LOC127794738 [Diospyros lotus]
MSNNIRMFIRMIHEEVEDDEEDEAIATALVEQYAQYMDHDFFSHHGGSVLNHRIINRNRAEGHERLYRDYFADSPTYPSQLFCRRFRVLGLSLLQKMTAILRMLAYGSPADAVDEYVRIGESTVIENLKKFTKAVVEIFGEQYLRRPNTSDIARLMSVAEQRGFPGHAREPIIILEAIASYDLWIWHAFFRLPGSLNDINVLDRSHVFSELAEGRGPKVSYTINGHEYTMRYYLADGIYPSWRTFVKTISSPQGNKKKYFAAQQEYARKDVERAFGVLQSRFAIVRGPGHMWDVETLKFIMASCIILHNMIVEDERDTTHEDVDFNYDAVAATPTIDLSRNHTSEVMEFIQVHHQIRDKQTHVQLQNDLVEHLWELYGKHST